MKSFLLFLLSENLSKKLNKISSGEIIGSHQYDNDPDTKHISNNGKTFTDLHPSSKSCQGNDGDCHWNVAKLHKSGKIDSIGIGYAKNMHGWHQHTWGVKEGKVVETTPSNMHNTHWHGSVLSKTQADKFSDHVLDKKNSPGNGNVRTKKGGFKIT